MAHSQARLLKQRGYDVAVFAGDNAPNPERYAVRRDVYDDISVFRTSLWPQDYQSEFVNFSHAPVEAQFSDLLDSFSPNVVHMHNIIGLSVGIIQIAKRKRIRTVLTLHDHWGFCYKNTLIKAKMEICQDYSRCAECMPFIDDEAERHIPIRMRQDFMRFQLNSVDAFVSPSVYLAEVYVRAGIPIAKMNVIWNGLDVARFSSVNKTRSNKIRFSFIGHFGAHKGIDVLLDALHMIGRAGAVSMNLVGCGELLEHIRDRVPALGLNNVVKLWGKVDNSRIEEVFSETDVLILPSIWPENQPVSITEAMATRTAVIASAIGGIPELVNDGINGYLFQPGSATDLKDKMLKFINDPELVRRFGEKGFEIIRQHSLDAEMDKICRLYG